MTETSETESAQRRERRPILRLRYAIPLLLLIAVGVALLYPPAFRTLLKGSIAFELKRYGVSAEIGKVGGSLFSPLSFSDVRIETNASLVRKATIKADKVTASFAPLQLFRGDDGRWLKRLYVDGASAELDIAGRGSLDPARAHRRFFHRISLLGWLPSLVPARVEVANSRVILRRHENVADLSDVSFSFARNQPGTLRIGSLNLTHHDLAKHYTDLSSSIGIKDSQLVIGNLGVGDSIRLRSLGIDLDDLADKRLNLDYDFQAFGGTVRGDVMSRQEAKEIGFEGTGSFRHLDVHQVGSFVGSESSTGGILDEGKFTFRGSLHRPEDAAASLRIRATDFQWGERRWHLLVAGATLADRRVVLHELSLEQSGNKVDLSGVFDLPEGNAEWWSQNFELHVSAQINDLAQFSALLGPEAARASGRIDLDGSVRGSEGHFNGQVIATASNITYRGVPIDSFNAAARIRGNELQVRHFELLRGDDFVRGECVVNILGTKQYWAELKASIADLKTYSPLVQPPIAPTAFSGGLDVEWSGDGTAKAHSGAFQATFRQLFPLEIRTTSAPLDGTMVATYSPGHIFFSTFELGSGQTNFKSRVTVAPDYIKLEDMHIQQDGQSRLAGSALLPVNAWAGWASADFDDVVRSDGKIAATLQATALPLGESLRLTGKSIPIKGLLDGDLTLTGSLEDLHASGTFTLDEGSVLAEGRTLVDGVSAVAMVEDNKITISEASGRALGGEVTGKGTVLISAPENLILDLQLAAEGFEFKLQGGHEARVDLAVNLQGPPTTSTITGSAQIRDLKLAAAPDLGSLISSITDGSRAVPVRLKAKPFRQWKLSIDCRQKKPIVVSDGKVRILPNVRLEGQASAPALSGDVQFLGVRVKAHDEIFLTDEATVVFGPDLPGSPILVAEARSAGQPIAIFGPFREPEIARTPDSQPIRLSIVDRPSPPDFPSDETPFTLVTSAPTHSDGDGLDIDTGKLQAHPRKQ